jgi:hypothetical protein
VFQLYRQNGDRTMTDGDADCKLAASRGDTAGPRRADQATEPSVPSASPQPVP